MRRIQHKIYCKNCEVEKDLRYCNVCKMETENLVKVELVDKVNSHESIGPKHKRDGTKRFLRKIFQGWKPSGDPKLQEGVNIQMVVDRENNEYHHIVKDAVTDKILHCEHEPLSEHRSK